MTAVLLAEQDAAIAEPVARALQGDGYDVERCSDGPTALSWALSGQVELVLLNAGLPGMGGVEVCKRVREHLPTLPVVLLADRAGEHEAVAGLDAGADDVVTDPFRLAELSARVRAVLRRSGGTGLAVGEVRIDVNSRRVWRADSELSLTSKEFDLLRVLMREAGTVVTREQLMREVWDATWWGSTKTLDMHISWLRRKLGDDPGAPRYISTVRGVGFRFELGS